MQWPLNAWLDLSIARLGWLELSVADNMQWYAWPWQAISRPINMSRGSYRIQLYSRYWRSLFRLCMR